jgi:hypothetical protein
VSHTNHVLPAVACLVSALNADTLTEIITSYIKVLVTLRMVMMMFWVVTLCRFIVSPSSALKMERGCFSEMLVSTYKSTQPYNLEKQHCKGASCFTVQ